MKSICILRLSAIGDVCHALALVNVIKGRWPDCVITWVLGKAEAQLMAGLDGVELVVFDKKAGYQGMKAVWQQLKGRRFEALLHMQIALRASVLSLGIKAERRIGFDRSRAGEGQWLFTRESIAKPQGLHVLDNFLEFARHLGIEDPKPNWSLPLPQAAKDQAAELLPAGQPSLVICHSASKAQRSWLADRYAEVADWAAKEGIRVLLCGGPSPAEVALGQAIEAAADKPLVNLTGQTDLKTLWALLGRADAVLAPDTGPAHMASSQFTPTVGLYAHSNPRRTGPYNHLQLVVNRYDANILAQTAKPWQQLPWGKRAKGDHLMAGIGVDEVIDRLKRILLG
ncbi:glycosyltransferase family 9 protein [Gallaecimonas xiamenensis]|uniref:Lipopolysaccharide biosynthesis protein n=1 Tax=Gallaecimonas xiamenensis 3-C-1 TaxID=745411 RepID=K2IJF9_9GAMM|nr:glycosyltransferase family 9 protein [Gallaecimonas xiamenensis]EKE70266.1 lipopolysaccharide biosynthesis protein [Gallaecimonas xiamenensis 3-C-1]